MNKRIIFLCFCSILFSGILYSQKIENIVVTQEGNIIIINYDLLVEDNSKKYDISLELSQNGGATYTLNPKTLSGDVRENVLPGKKKKISWDVLKDIAELKGENFVFKIIALDDLSQPKVQSGGIPTWIWIGGGAVLAGGAAIILGGKKSSSSTITPTTPDLPAGPDFPSIPK